VAVGAWLKAVLDEVDIVSDEQGFEKPQGFQSRV